MSKPRVSILNKNTAANPNDDQEENDTVSDYSRPSTAVKPLKNRRQSVFQKPVSTLPIPPASTAPKNEKPLPLVVLEVISEIQSNWNFMTLEKFNAVPIALSLLDNSSLGRDLKAFTKIYERLEKAMDLIVNDYHQGFSDAIQKFSGVVDNISDSKTRSLAMHADLVQCIEWLQNKRFDLFHLWIKSMQHKEMMRILDRIEELMKVPDEIENLVQGKFFLTACRLLSRSLNTLNSDDFNSIEALEGIKMRLEEWKLTLPEMMIEELHNHVYLKSPFSLDKLGLELDESFKS